MNIFTILILLLILGAVGTAPHWGYSTNWGYGPAGGLGGIVLLLIVLRLLGVI